MKKFISLAMAMAMTLSLVPATAFAATNGKIYAKAVKIVKVADLEVKNGEINGPELQIKVDEVEYDEFGTATDVELTLELDNAKFVDKDDDPVDPEVILTTEDGGNIKLDDTNHKVTVNSDRDEATILIKVRISDDDVIAISLPSTMTKTSVGKEATVTLTGDINEDVDDLVYAQIVKKGLTASVKKLVNIAEEEVTTLIDKGLKIEFEPGTFDEDETMTLKISKGFEFVETDLAWTSDGEDLHPEFIDDDEIELPAADIAHFISPGGALKTDEMTIYGLEIEATSADAGDIAKITVKYNGCSSVVEVAEVVDYKVILSVDEDEDVPVIYNGVDVDNTGLTDDADHWALEVTAEETFPGAWSMRQGFNFTLPEGVYVTDVDVVEAENFYQNDSKDEDGQKEVGVDAWKIAFEDAYEDGEYNNFDFKKRVFNDVNTVLNDDEAKVVFKLQLVADPSFEGDVVLGFEGSLVDTQEATIATFVKPYTVSAEQNDLVIDYRYTEVGTPIVVVEAADGLFDKGAKFTFSMEEYMDFEGDASYDLGDSEMELKAKDTNKNDLTFTVKSESDTAATITISDLELFMNRSIPAGPYDLDLTTTMYESFLAQQLYAHPDYEKNFEFEEGMDPDDYSKASIGEEIDPGSTVTVKEAFVNVITAGRDQDDASFTTKVVVPVGEMYLISGENQVALDVPAYITAAGYTMLPVRAVAKALGINNNNVLWNAEARTATILYGQRIITMTVGAKVVNVNGSALPASAAVEITNSRTFLPMRDLATALGVTDITWDAATKTATLNGSGNK